jgi:hypothetical protein
MDRVCNIVRFTIVMHCVLTFGKVPSVFFYVVPWYYVWSRSYMPVVAVLLQITSVVYFLVYVDGPRYLECTCSLLCVFLNCGVPACFGWVYVVACCYVCKVATFLLVVREWGAKLLLYDNCMIVLNTGFDISVYSSFRWLLFFVSMCIWYLSIVFRCIPFLCVCKTFMVFCM